MCAEINKGRKNWHSFFNAIKSARTGNEKNETKLFKDCGSLLSSEKSSQDKLKNSGMADDNTPTHRTPERQLPGLDADASLLNKLAKALAAAVKSRAFERPEYAKQIEEASKLAGQINWNDVKANIDREASVVRERNEANLTSRREKLLQAASAAQWAAQQGSQIDLIDIFQVVYEGAIVVVKLGGVPLERIQETDGEKVFARIRQLRTGLDQNPFHRESFFKLLKAAHAICRRTQLGGDEFVPVRELHREMVLERARSSDLFRKNADLKNIDPYPLTQFIFDLARFTRDGAILGTERIMTQTPAMRESKEMIHIPNLNHPTNSETTAARLAIRPV